MRNELTCKPPVVPLAAKNNSKEQTPMQPIFTSQKEQNAMGFYLLAAASAALAVTITLTNLEQLLRVCGAVLFLVSSALSLITAWRNSRR